MSDIEITTELPDTSYANGAPITSVEQTVSLAGPPGPGGGGGSGGVIATVVAGETLSGHRAVVLHTDGLAYYASNDAPDDATRQVWLTLGAGIEGTSVQIQQLGVVTEPSWAWADGPIFLGASGVLTQTPPVAPAFIMQLAQPNGLTSLVFNPRTPIAL